MKTNLKLFATLILMTFVNQFQVKAQVPEASNWYFGCNAAINFNAGVISSITSPLTNREGVASISDASGNTLFYTNGTRVWDGSNTMVNPLNVDALHGNPSSTQSAIIVPDPANADDYYIFTVDAYFLHGAVPNLNPGTGTINWGLNYYTVNTTGGTVTVNTTETNLLGASMGTEKITAAKKCTGDGYWVITIDRNDAVIVYDVDGTGVSLHSVFNSTIGSTITADFIGYLKLSPNATRLVNTKLSGSVDVYDFDNATGLVSGSGTLPTVTLSNGLNNGIPYGCEFSNNGDFLYVSTLTSNAIGAAGKVVRYDLGSGSTTGILIGTSGVVSTSIGALQRGPDNQIYFSMETTNTSTSSCAGAQQFLGVIADPDNTNAALVGFNSSFYDLTTAGGTGGKIGLPTFISSYFYAIVDAYSTTCLNATDGFAIATPYSLCDGPYTFTWSNGFVETGVPGGASSTATGLSAGTYTVTITDASGDIETETFVIADPTGQTNCCFAQGNAQYTQITADITYTTDQIWDNKIYIGDNVTVSVDATLLDITNVDVVFGECAQISFLNGATLRANNSVFRPCDPIETYIGLSFLSGSTAEINECTFKNAETALLFNGTGTSNPEGNITNNLFSNCHYGVLTLATTFNQPISGNTFYIDETVLDDDCFNIPTQSYVGIASFSSTYNLPISQNSFINGSQDGSKEYIGIDLNQGEAIISNNQFTNMLHSFNAVNSSEITFENNEIEVMQGYNFADHQINLFNSNDAWIAGNELTESTVGITSINRVAIYAESSDGINIINNSIDGFSAGVQILNVNDSQISENEIRNAAVAGIWHRNGNRVNVSCNTINMMFNGTTFNVGYVYLQTVAGNLQNEVRSNCISESYFSMLYFGIPNTMLPQVENNYLFNYTNFGIYIQGFNGNIGNALAPYTEAGRNTFNSNNIMNGAVDIFSVNTPVLATGNFGISTVSNNVTVIGNNLYNSTATCGNQLGTVSAQLTPEEECDNFIKIFTNLVVEDNNTVRLADNFAANLAMYPKEEDLPVLINSLYLLHRYGKTNDALTFKNTAQTELPNTSATWINYYYAQLTADQASAMAALQNIVPTTPQEQDRHFLEAMRYSVSLSNTAQFEFSADQLSTLETMSASGSHFAESANNLLRFGLLDRNLRFDPLTTTEPVEVDFSMLKELEEESNMQVFPNPSNGQVNIAYQIEDMGAANVVVYSITGQLLHTQALQYAQNEISMELGTLPAGIYLVSIQNDGIVVAQQRIVKE